MKILVLNCGSSSIKYQFFDVNKKEVLSKGIVDKIGLKGANIQHNYGNGNSLKLEGEIIDHKAGIEYLLGILISKKYGCIKKIEEINAVGHRVVHGGEKFNKSVLITDEVIKDIEECIELAPLHNPHNLKGINSIKAILPDVPQVAVFDTAFHQSMQQHSFLYAIPYSLYEKYKIRRYGFHGTSHRYVSVKACEILKIKQQDVKIISCHLGNGSSIAAIDKGISIDTSMGMTPVEGLIMGTRCGDIDAGVLLYIMHKEEIGLNYTNTLINKHSGLLGISGVSSDMRDLEESAYKKSNQRAKLALEMFVYRIKKYIGAYTAVMNGLDILVFTGGIGENALKIREDICKGLDYLGIELETDINANLKSKDVIISKPKSKVKIMVIATNEELVIAMDTYEVIDSLKKEKK